MEGCSNACLGDSPLQTIRDVIQCPLTFAQMTTKQMTEIIVLDDGSQHRHKTFEAAINELAVAWDIISPVAG